MRARLALLPALLLLAAALAGCVTLPGVSAEQAAQPAPLGPVRVTTTLCPFVVTAGATGAPIPPAIPAGGVAGSCAKSFQAVPTDATHDLPGQLLIAYRIPAGASAPATLSGTADVRPAELLTGRGANPVQRTPISFARSPELERELREWYEAPAQSGAGPDALPAGLDAALLRSDEQLVAYISDALPGPVVSDLVLTADFGLPSANGTQPFTGPFRHLTLTGWRLALPAPLPGRGTVPGTASPSRPPSCRTTPSAAQVVADLRGGAAAPGDLTVCPLPVGPLPATTGGTSATKLLAGTTTDTRDVAVVGGASAAEQGSVVPVPFAITGTGPAVAGAPLSLRAGGGVPGSTPAPRQGQVPFPAGRTDQREVIVGVPPSTPPGTYDVVLRVLAGGQERTGVAKLTVVPRAAPYVITDTPAGPEVVLVVNYEPAPAGPDDTGRRSSRPDVRLERLRLSRTGRTPFGYVCPATSVTACRRARAWLLIPETMVGRKPRAGQPPLMLRIGQGAVRGWPDRRVRAWFRASPAARNFVGRGKRLRALLVIRPADDSRPQVRRVEVVRG